MAIDERRKYSRLMNKRYAKANRAEKGRLLDEMETATGLHRKALIRLMSGDLQRKSRRKQRGCMYGGNVHATITAITESVDCACGERLQPSLVWLAEHVAQCGELRVSPELMTQPGKTSVPTGRRGRQLERCTEADCSPQRQPAACWRMMLEAP